MGVVYEAEQVRLGRRVALKVLPAHVAADRKALERFRREAKAAAGLHHTNIVPVFEVGRDGEVAYYAMQFIQGQGLDQVIGELRRLRDHGEVQRAAAASLGSTGRARRRAIEHLRRDRRPRSAGRRAAPERPTGDRRDGIAASGRRTCPGRPGSRPSGSGPGRDFGLRLDGRRPGSTSPWLAARDRSASAVLPGGTQISTTESRRPPAAVSSAAWRRSAARRRRGWPTPTPAASSTATSSRRTCCWTRAGVVWITDFGLAKADDDGLTATGDILGTLRYMAPERFRGEGGRPRRHLRPGADPLRAADAPAGLTTRPTGSS